jgi:hypothetical protein
MENNVENGPGPINPQDQEISSEQHQQTVQLLLLHGDIMQQLMQFERFQFFLTANYDVHLNEEAQRFEVKEFPHADVKQNMEALYKAKHAEKSPIIQGLSVEEAQKFSK